MGGRRQLTEIVYKSLAAGYKDQVLLKVQWTIGNGTSGAVPQVHTWLDLEMELGCE